MKQPKFFTVYIDDKCIDLPKDTPIPQHGDKLFIAFRNKDYVGIVDYLCYHYTENLENNLYMIEIYTKSL